ncbi:hypothetical protein LHFGNBLO_004406 [Mesorhizobium sp. AR10]|uniref:hypothetical protein n=1 Tax=Mesorhizobium sp. AR10 TaxID=2865839 RepID=UPI002160D9DB|nr:hypothetical protein [Mesorhizobium sp. AR10]UVK37383.1 hypothetical protein LHFGNBLO_004406 [Mesorhizobium sp. AR10]
MTVLTVEDGDNRFALLWQRSFFDSDLPRTTKLALAGLVTYMDPDGSNCFPSIQALADRCSLTKAGALPHLHLARDRGFLLIIETEDPRGKGWRRHSYKPIIPDMVVNGVDYDGSNDGQMVVNGVDYDGSMVVNGVGGVVNGVGGVVNGVDPTYPITYPKNLSPLTPTGEQEVGEEKSDWDSGKKGRPAFKMYPGTPGFDRWCGYYRACGNEDRVSEAVRLGYVAGTTTYPPTVGAGQQSNREASA